MQIQTLEAYVILLVVTVTSMVDHIEKIIWLKKHLSKLLKLSKFGKYKTMDITGGAPEMNPNFRWF